MSVLQQEVVDKVTKLSGSSASVSILAFQKLSIGV